MLGKDKLNTIAVEIFKALIDSYISHDEFLSGNNVLRIVFGVGSGYLNIQFNVLLLLIQNKF